jgi:hypothetical protein
MSVKRAALGIFRAFDKMDNVDVATRLTLIMFLLFNHTVGEEWFLKSTLRTIAFLGILVPGLNRSRPLWILVTVLLVFKTLGNWWTQDNHLFVLMYWSLALTLALGQADPVKSIQTSARILIGISFAFATLWKGFLSPDYMDGTYFHHTFLEDFRFHDLSVIVGRISEEAVASNIELLRGLTDPAGEATATLQSTEPLSMLAVVVTWWTILIEAVLGLTFLWPGTRGPSRFRNWALLVFGVSTYIVAIVPTFGWVLLMLGAAQCREDEGLQRFLCALMCIIVTVYSYVVILSFVRPYAGVG